MLPVTGHAIKHTLLAPSSRQTPPHQFVRKQAQATESLRSRKLALVGRRGETILIRLRRVLVTISRVRCRKAKCRIKSDSRRPSAYVRKKSKRSSGASQDVKRWRVQTSRKQEEKSRVLNDWESENFNWQETFSLGTGKKVAVYGPKM